MKKFAILAFIAFSLFAALPTNKSENPIPMCNPCDWVR
jgi:hypothetical protein